MFFGSRDGRVADDDGRGVVRYSASVFTTDQSVVPALAPPDGPRVLDGPVLHAVFLAEPDDQDSVVDL